MKNGLFNWQLPKDISVEPNKLSTTQLNADLYFLNKEVKFKDSMYLSAGRIYLPLNETINVMNGEIQEKEDSYIININSKQINVNKNDKGVNPPIIEIENNKYISMVYLLVNLNYVPVFDTNANRIDILYSQQFNNNITLQNENSNKAYLRLEDIMADGLDKEGYYNDIGLENLRVIADYLYNNNQKFYIAWIPLYKNPKNNIENDLTKDFNLYNASFLYTLDYLTYKGGKIGLHGYTHQYNEEKSADGFEFGKETPFSEKECVNRMLLAKQVARDLGYEITFFEFPHYSATKNHLRYAENYFTVIYQQDTTSSQNKGKIIEKTKKGNKTVKYVPTPADYVISRYDIDGINSRIDKSIQNDWVVSLFYHPKIDFEVMERKTENNTRICNVNQNCVIYQLVDKINSENLKFDYFD